MTGLVVIAGLPGTGKTTLARAVAPMLGAAYLRVDAVETAVEQGTGRPAGVLGYAVVWQVARTNLLLGTSVVVDAVCPVGESRAGWRELAAETGAELTVLEARLADRAEHRRRVESRAPDMPGQRVPTWGEVAALDYSPWDDERDGPRVAVDTADGPEALRAALSALRSD